MKIDNRIIFVLLIILMLVKIVEITAITGYTIGTVDLTVTLIPEGSVCSSNTQCYSEYCCHNICRLSCPYCGDQYCDYPEEDYKKCPEDCMAEEVKIISFIERGEIKTVEMENQNLKIRKIEIFAEKDIANASIKIKEIVSLPVPVPPETSYKHLEFVKENMEDGSINKMKITFNIEKTWIADNNIDSNKIVLQRYIDSWNKLLTSKTTESDTYITYEAESLGFSYFTITGEKKSIATATEDTTHEPTHSNSIITPGGIIKKEENIIITPPIQPSITESHFDIRSSIILPNSLQSIIPAFSKGLMEQSGYVKAGDMIAVYIEINNSEEGKSQDVMLNYKILDNANNSIALEKEIISVETNATFVHYLAIPNNLSDGLYYVQVELMYGDQEHHVITRNAFTVCSICVSTETYLIIIFLIIIIILVVYYLKRVFCDKVNK